MRVERKHPAKRLLAMFLCVAMLIGMIPSGIMWAHAQDVQYTVSVALTGDATVKLNGTEQNSIVVDDGSEVEVEITPNSGWYIETLTLDGVGETVTKGESFSTTITVDGKDFIIGATVVKGCMVTATATPDDGGSVTVNGVSSTLVAVGENVQLNVVAEEGYRIDTVMIGDEPQTDVEANATSYQKEFSVSDNTNVTVNFVKVHTITVEYAGNGSVTINGEETAEGTVTVTVDAGSTLNIHAVPQEGYRVSQVLIDKKEQSVSGENDSEYQDSMPADDVQTIEITFALNRYKVTVLEPEHGTVKVKDVVEYGEDLRVELLPDAGYTVESVLVNGEVAQPEDPESETPYIVVKQVKGELSIQATFALTSEANMEDVSFNFEDAIRSFDGTYVFSKGSTVTFSTEKNAIKLTDAQGNDYPRLGLSREIKLQESVSIVRIQLRYKDEDDWWPDWHTVPVVTTENPLNIVIDTTAPTITMTPDEEGDTNGIYKDDVRVDVSVVDPGDYSGLESISYTVKNNGAITQQGDLPISESQGQTGGDTIVVDKSKNNSSNVEVTVTSTDKAGNTSTQTIHLDIDTTAPTIAVAFDNNTDFNGNGYFKENRTATVTITERENHFDKDEVRIVVNGERLNSRDIRWEEHLNEENPDLSYFTANIPFDEDADYEWSVEYTDKAGHPAPDAQTGDSVAPFEFTVDTAVPVLKFDFDEEEQVAKFEVEEHNFRAEDITVTGEIKDIVDGNVAVTAEMLTQELRTAEWERDEKSDTYTYSTAWKISGIYNLKLDYTDLAGNQAVQYVIDPFVVDHEKPYDVSISYSEPLMESILEAITFGFYQANVEVTFTAYDMDSGVESFTWSYTKEKDASDVNRPTDDEDVIADQVVNAVQDDVDHSKFTATITLPEKEAEQLRGYISVVAEDRYGNAQSYADEDHVVVVDGKKPTMKVDYSQEDNQVGDIRYYKGDATMTFTINEANFFQEDVQVMVSKDGGVPYQVEPAWTDESADVHIGTYTFTEDGDYVVTVTYTDRSGNVMEAFISDVVTVDTIIPVTNVDYKNTGIVQTLKDNQGNDREYFDATQTAVVTITEHNFNADDVKYVITAQDVAGNALEMGKLVSMSEWETKGDVHTMTITYPGDANYSFDVSYADLATNEAADYATDYFTVDKTAPENLRVEYSTSVLDTVLESVSFGFYNAKMTVTITADDPISGVHSFLYSYLNAKGVSSVNAQLLNQAISAAEIRYSNGGATATASFEIPKMVLAGDNQFNGTVEFTATDRSDKESAVHKETKRIVVDNINPTAQVTYNDPVNVEGDISYYDGDIHASIAIHEANFYAEDVQVMVSKDGGTATSVVPTWQNNSVDDHVGTFTLSGDGDYVVTVQYRDKSSNQMETYTSKQMTIDTQIEAPAFTINGNPVGDVGGAYKNDATVAFSFEDVNFATQTVQLIRTRFDAVEDVTAEFIKVGSTENGGSGSFSIPNEVQNDGIYTLTVGITDKAMHTTQAQVKFTINRFGSVYEYDDYLVSLIQDGGQYITIQDGETAAITEDLIITEYNADQLLEGSLRILITRDGENVDADYTTNPVAIDDTVSIGESGWYQYVYTIKASNFAEDGVYKIALSSAYATSDSEKNDSTSVPDNSMDGTGTQVMDTMSFTVDTTAPEIRNIVNLEKQIINAQNVDVKYTIVDVGGLKSIEVILNGQVVDTITDFDEGGFNYNGQFTIQESSDAQTVQLRATDLAGNVTDTASESFNANELFEFHDTVIVSTNFFVRWYADKPLFWGSICGIVVVIGAIFGVVVTKRKKKVESK